MISKHKIKYKDGTYKTNVRIVEGYRPGPGMAPKQRQIKNLGYAEDYEDQDAFWKMVEEEERKFKESKESIEVQLDPSETLKDTKRFELGYKYLDAVYDFLEIDKFLEALKVKVDYDYKKIFRYLVTERILHADSIRSCFQKSENRYGYECDFQYHQIIRCLDLIEDNMESLQDHLNKVIKHKIGRKTEYVFYDTTNFYMEKDYAEEGTLGQKGVSKEHRTEPIVQYGMFMDSNKLPVRMQVFPGNTSDSTTYLPMIKSLKNKYGYDRIVSVADKGMNNTNNISYIHFNGDGYVFSQILKGKKGKRYHEKMFEDEEFIYNEDKTYKYRIFEEDFQYVQKDEKGKIIKKETAKRKVLIYWKKSIADREAHKRELKLRKAEKFATNNAYGLKHDATDYVKEEHIDSSTGAVSDKVVKAVDTEKAENDAKFDGFFCIVTSEIDYDRLKIHEVYGELSKIEESFRICKSDLNARPMFVHTDDHIRAHFMICFTALLIVRLIGFKLGDNQISAERIQRALASFGCEEIAKGIIRLSMSSHNNEYIIKKDEEGNEYSSLLISDNNETIEDLIKLQNIFGGQFIHANVKQENLNKYIKSINFAITKQK